jgi:hypothetical protein
VNPKTLRWVLVWAIYVTGFFDLLTFLIPAQYIAFEINPLWQVTKNVAIMVIFKVVVLFGFSYAVLRGSRFGWLSYAVVLTSLYVIIGQVYAGISNLQVTLSHPSLDQVLPPSVATQKYFTIVILYQLLPLFMATMAFQVHKWGKYECQ